MEKDGSILIDKNHNGILDTLTITLASECET